VQLEVDDPRRISVHLAPIPQPPTRDDIVASQKSRFEDQDKTIDYIVLLLFAPFENSKWPPAIIIVHWTICNGYYPDLGTFLL
jgi:hypothetical protein